MKIITALVVGVLIGACSSAFAASKPASSIPASSLIQPADLAAVLQSAGAPQPLILQVGFRTMYAQAHILGAEYAGPANEEPGLQRLRERVVTLPKDTPMIIYCGCCPWGHCPNVGEAFAALRGLGFTQVKVMYIAENFGDDWVSKGYPVAKGP